MLLFEVVRHFKPGDSEHVAMNQPDKSCMNDVVCDIPTANKAWVGCRLAMDTVGVKFIHVVVKGFEISTM